MVCLSIIANDFEECRRVLNEYSFIEFRLDKTVFNLNEIQELFASPNQLIATCRSGKFSENERLEILKTALNAGASYVDIDINSSDNFKSSIINHIENTNSKLIISYHNYDNTPDKNKLIRIIEKMKSTKADIYKIATEINGNEDLINVFSLYQYFAKGKLIAFGMGEKGRISRVVAEFLGSPFTYASIEANKSTAPGQIDYHSLTQIMDLLK